MNCRRCGSTWATSDAHPWFRSTVALLALLGACGSADDEASPTTTSASTYCSDLDALGRVLDEGGSEQDYERRLATVAEAGPPEHAPTWELLLTLSTQPFTYDSFNPAVDSLDAIWDELTATCPGVSRLVVDDDGRLRRPAG